MNDNCEDDKENTGKESEFAVPLPPMPKQTSSHNVSAAMPASSQIVPETVANSQVSDVAGAELDGTTLCQSCSTQRWLESVLG